MEMRTIRTIIHSVLAGTAHRAASSCLLLNASTFLTWSWILWRAGRATS